MRHIIGGMCAVLALTGCAMSQPAAPATPAPVVIDSYLLIKPGYKPPVIGAVGDPCVIQSGYNDINDGAQVTVTDEKGEVIALGALSSGRIHETTAWLNGKTAASSCTFPFSVTAPNREFYGIEVAHRGVVRFTRDQVEQGVHLTLG